MATVAGPSAPAVTSVDGSPPAGSATGAGRAVGGGVDHRAAAWEVMCMPTPVTSPNEPGSARRVAVMAARAWVA